MNIDDVTRWWWLSFAADVPVEAPPGSGFLGGCYVPATTFERAVEAATLLGLNPGGEVRGWPMVRGMSPEEHHRYRLFSLSEMPELGGAMPAAEADRQEDRQTLRRLAKEARQAKDAKQAGKASRWRPL